LNRETFDDCYKHYLADYSLGETLKSLAVKWKYKSGEHLRWEMKAERIRRGIPPKGQTPVVIPHAKLNVAVLDIETLPMIYFGWGIWDQNIGINQIIAGTCLLAWAGKVLNSSEIHSDVLTPSEAILRNPARIARSCWEFLSDKDAIIGHNIQSFDMKLLNLAFLQYGLPPLKFILIDTYLIAKQSFRFDSNKMEYINNLLGIRNKIEHEGFPLWRKCNEGDVQALAEMSNYNCGDVLSSEDLYYRIRPYVRNFNVALYNEINTYQCPVCGSEKVHTEGLYYSPKGKWESVRCEHCGCLSRKGENLLSKDKKKVILTNS
jgi:hypothetical protein